MDKDEGMKEHEATTYNGTTGWWGKLGEVEEDSRGAPRGGGAGQCFVVYTHIHVHIHAHNIQCQCHERRLWKIGRASGDELWEKAREEDSSRRNESKKEPPAIVANTGMKPGVYVRRENELDTLSPSEAEGSSGSERERETDGGNTRNMGKKHAELRITCVGGRVR